MWATLVVGALSLLCIATSWLLHIKHRFRNIAHVPGPKPVFLLGNALQLSRNPADCECQTLYHGVTLFPGVMHTLFQYTKQYGKWMQIWIGPTIPYLWISDVKFMEFILTSNVHIDKSLAYVYLQPWLGEGLLVAGGAKWKPRRKLLTPAFHFKVLLHFVDVFNRLGDILVEQLSTHVGKPSVDITPLMSLYTLDIICETAMGTPVNAQRNENSEYVRAVHNSCRILIERLLSVWKQFDVLYKFSSSYKVEMQSLKILHDFTDSVIARRKAEMQREEAAAQRNRAENTTADDEGALEGFDVPGIKSRFAFLDLLMKSSYDGQQLSDADVREEVDTIMFAGHDTTAAALSFLLYEIARHPDVQEKLVEELRAVFADDRTRPVTFQDLNQRFKYMEMVIKESLRLYPSVPYFGRELKEDLNYEGLVLPKGVTLALFTFAMHRDPELFPEPEQFKPERFLLESMRSNDPFSYIPFSAGPRNCIGQKFAMLLMKATLAKILRHFVLLPVPGHKLHLYSELVLKSYTGACVQLKKREDF